MLLSALASVVELRKSESRKQKRGVAFFGSPGYDFFSIVPAFSPSSWGSTGLAASAWNPPSTPDIALTQVQVQATHNVALQVRTFINISVHICREISEKRCSLLICTTGSERPGTGYTDYRVSARSPESDSTSKRGE